jgi:adenylate cyclase
MEAAVLMALEAREELTKLKKKWDERNYEIDFGMGLSAGYATIGGIGFDRFSQYSVIGTVANFASRLCHLAVSGQILVSQRFSSRLKAAEYKTNSLGQVTLKGIEKSVTVYNILSFKK